MALPICLRKLGFLFNRTYCTKTSEKIVLTSNGSMFVCWHPKTEYPYEYTKPVILQPLEESNSLLKSTWNSEIKQIFKKKHPDVARQELVNLTFTTKHRWYPRSRDKRAKNTPMDREYL